MSKPPIAKPRYTADQVADAITKARGMVSVAARNLGCHPDTVRAYKKRYASVAAAFAESRESTTDMAELSLFKAISEGEAWAVSLYLKTIGKNRGYVERLEQQHSGPDGGPLTLTVTVIDDRSA